MKTSLGKNLVLDNPFIAASGTCGYGTEYADIISPESWGAMVLKTVTLNPRAGNPPPRVCDTDAGMLNSIGLANDGVDNFLKAKLAYLTGRFPQVKAISSIAGETTKEFTILAEKIGESNEVKAIELNFSCPNVAKGGIHFGADTLSAKEAVSECRKVTKLPLWVKISPVVSNPVDLAAACIEAGADAIVAGNTIPGMVIDIRKQTPKLGNITGGLSGPAIFPASLKVAYQICSALKGITVIGCGGINNADKAIQYILAGCSAVEIGTAVFRHPDLLLKLINDFSNYMEDFKFNSIEDFKGKALQN